MTRSWAQDSVFYHIYPLGLCGAPPRNDFAAPVTARLEQLYGWIDHIRSLGANAVYLGPVFESTAHGYDTVDYIRVDRRLGSNDTLRDLVAAFHHQGMHVILDAVFNHVGRDFWAFRDVMTHQEQSAYRDWFAGLSFGPVSPFGDPFTYQGWNGHLELVKLNLDHPDVRAHLFQAVSTWIEEFDIDGLRLDAADAIDRRFLRELAAHCKKSRPEFWLVGEVVHGDYRQWANGETLDSATNYECYKGLYSSHVDRNYFEIAYALNRQFGAEGLYRGLPLYAFADNHDVNRVVSNLRNPAHLYPLYGLLLTMPGVPSIYYGSEWGLGGVRSTQDDSPLRPHLDLAQVRAAAPHPDLAPAIARLAMVRRALPALRHGDYRQLYVAHEQLAFQRQTRDECVVVTINASSQPAPFVLDVSVPGAHRLVDHLNGGVSFPVCHREVRLETPPCWTRILRVE